MSDLRKRIEERAYHIYKRRQMSGKYGDAVGDWIQAEKEILEEIKKESKPAKKQKKK